MMFLVGHKALQCELTLPCHKSIRIPDILRDASHIIECVY